MTTYKDLSNLHFEDADIHRILEELNDLRTLVAAIETKIAEYHTRHLR